MSDEWKDLGAKDDPIGVVANAIGIGDSGAEHVVENKETGETRTVDRQAGQTVGKAIEAGQFTDKK